MRLRRFRAPSPAPARTVAAAAAATLLTLTACAPQAPLVDDPYNEIIEGAAGGRRNEGWRSTGTDANAENAPALAKLRKDNGKKLNGIVLDLRNNPGGVLQSAVEVVDHFITKGLIVYTKGRIANSELRFSATGNDLSENVPLAVLINGGSASASEIVAGALQDQKRGVLMGTTSFGKGSVQTVLPLNNERALKITTALYYTPNGRSIQAQGIVPDIEVRKAKITNEIDSEYYKEADLQGHLGNGNGGADQPTGSGAKAKPMPQDDDYQLAQALSLLKGLSITRSR